MGAYSSTEWVKLGIWNRYCLGGGDKLGGGDELVGGEPDVS